MPEILGIGADILLLERMRESITSPSFMRRTFTEMEMSSAEPRADVATYYAEVFAAKEAVFKCLGVQADALRSWTDIEIVDSGEARPQVDLRGGLSALARERGAGQVFLSLSHDTEYATAVAVMVGGRGSGGRAGSFAREAAVVRGVSGGG